MPRVKLGDICYYKNETVGVHEANLSTYVSTESMLPNRGGVTFAASLPQANRVKSYARSDVLVSNIRPYFKKIWRADNDGTCSNDILVFRACECMSEYLYWVLCDDAFFSHMTKTAKGTKMPRGDKTSIMEYEAFLPPETQQKAICSILSGIQKKIELNNRLNGYLGDLRNALVKEKISNALESGASWKTVPLKEVAQIQSGYSYKSAELMDSAEIGLLGIKNFSVDGSFKEDGFKPIEPAKAKPGQFVALGEIIVAHTDLTQNADIIGRAVQVIDAGGYERMIASCDLVKVSSLDDAISNELLAALLGTEDFHNHCLGYVNGTTVLHLGKKALPEYELKIPEDTQLKRKLDSIFKVIAMQQSTLIQEKRALKHLRDALLPRLMSGEIDVSKVDLTQLNSHLGDC